ncbi:MAG TPA: chorismate synthase [Ruminococcaceae bacterium]|nr:chorismate synthase [Oscillospiraceae bacterium]
MSSCIGSNFKISVFGESHGEGIGVVIDGAPAGKTLDFEEILAFMARRAPGKNKTSTQRKETDYPFILSGVVNNVTCGTPICAVIKNSDQHSKDYSSIIGKARAGHADYTGFLRYEGYNDIRGGGHFSGRITAPLVFAGAVAKQILAQSGITVGAHISSIKNIHDTPFNPVEVDERLLNEIAAKDMPVIDDNAGLQMQAEIEKARLDCNSVGGTVECAVVNVPAGIGSPIFRGLENVIAATVFGIPAVKGIQFGNGFEASTLTGEQNNDEFYAENGVIKTRTNNAGGILGGISNGMPIILKVVFKPTPSIAKEQKTVDFIKCENTTLKIEGRHDPCVVIRAVPVVEAAVAIAVLDCMLDA